MTTIPVTCNSCGNGFDADARKAGLSSPCPHCHARVNVPDVSVAQPAVPALAQAPPTAARSATIPRAADEAAVQRASRLFSALPRPLQFAVCALVFFGLGYFIAWVRMVAARYSPAAYQEQVARADKAERDLSAANATGSTLEAERSRFKVAAESSAKDVVHIRRLMNELRAEKDVPDWASKEKWAEAQAEIGRLRAANEENARLKAQTAKMQETLDNAVEERKSLSAKLAAAGTGKSSRDSRSTQPQPKASNGEEKADAEIAAETFVRRKLTHPSTAKFPFFGQAAKKNDDGTWTVVGTVNAKNSFNLETTMKYACQVKRDGDKWVLVDCLIAESDE